MDTVAGKIMSARFPEDRTGLDLYLEKAAEVISRNAASLPAVIQVLDPARNTLGLVWLASIRAEQNADRLAGEGTLQAVEALLARGDWTQLNGSARGWQRWRVLLHSYTQLTRDNTGYATRGLFYVKDALALRPGAHHLTPAHPDFLMLAIKTNNFRVALSTLLTPVLDVAPKDTGVDATDYLLYYYYGGLVFVALKRWADAKRFLEAALVMPGTAASNIMVEAYKVYLLVGAVSKGAFWPLPLGAPAALERATRELCRDYADLASACEARDVARAAKAAEVGGLLREAHKGLVRQAIDAVAKHHIVSLTATYITLSLDQMATYVAVPKADLVRQLLGMIDEGMIHAIVCTDTEMVSFTDPPRSQALTLEARMAEAMAVAERIRKVETQVELSQPFVLDKLRSHPHRRDILDEYEQRRKASRSLGSAVGDFVMRAAGGM